MPDRDRNWYARQKLWEAVGCLIDRRSFRDRLTAAAGPLAQLNGLHPDEVALLPERQRLKFEAVVGILTKHPPPTFPDLYHWESGITFSVRKMTPRQRAKAAQDILDLFVELSGGL
jgi:hypothetical protein